MNPPDRLEAVLAPRSVAIVGASDDPGKTAARPLRFLRQGGYAGRVYPVARRARVQGEPAWPALAALPERPDHAFILLPTEGAIEAVGECVRLGIPAATVLAGGFAESGAAGAAKEAALRALVRGSRTRLLGPNSLGLVNLHRDLVLTANAAFAEAALPRGGVFVASQSGSLIGALASRGKARGLGFAALVSVGGEADLGVGEICAAALDDPAVTCFALFLETIRDGAALRGFALGAAARGKPVLAYKLGRSAAAAELALSHTGALAGEDDLADAFLADCGIARVGTLEALLEAPPLLRRLKLRPRPPRPASVGIVTTTGGGAAMVVDQLGLRGVDVPEPAPETRARLAAAGITAGGRILDLTLAGTRPEVMRAALDALLAAPELDLVVAVIGSSARFQPELAVQPVLEAAGAEARLAVFLVPEAPDALARLAAGGVPAFRTPEACADAIAAAFARRVPHPRPAPAPAVVPATVPGALLDELQGYALLDTLGIPRAPSVTIMPGTAPALPFAYPVAAKALHAALAHKSEAGGVALDIGAPEELAAVGARIAAEVAARRPGLVVSRLLVQPMLRGLGEVLLGYRVDPQVGPVVLLAAGGVFTEIYRDRSVRLAPVAREEAEAMIGEVRALAPLGGLRGRPRGDLAALADAIVALSRLAERTGVAELEINPLLVLAEGRGVVAVDALGRLAGN